MVRCGLFLVTRIRSIPEAANSQLGINRVAQASSVNVITMVYSKKCDFKYFPIDEMHETNPDEPYGLSKLCVPSTML